MLIVGWVTLVHHVLQRAWVATFLPTNQQRISENVYINLYIILYKYICINLYIKDETHQARIHLHICLLCVFSDQVIVTTLDTRKYRLDSIEIEL